MRKSLMLLLAGYGLIALQLAGPSMLRIAGRRCSRSSTSVFGGVVAAMAANGGIVSAVGQAGWPNTSIHTRILIIIHMNCVLSR
jgi:hypothetical protein